MAQWSLMTQLIQFLPHETTNNLYPSDTFPIEVRHFLADWIEQQRWEDFVSGNMEQEARGLAQATTSVVEKMKLMQISREMRTVIVSMQDVDQLVLKVYEVQETRQKMHQLQEELNWEKQNFEPVQGTIHQNGLDSTNTEAQKLQNRIQQLEYNVNTMATKHFQLLQQCVDYLEQCQSRLITRLKTWRCEQHKATIGHPFDDNLNPLQTWCEQLLVVNGKLRQEVMLLGEHQFVSQLPELMERLGQLLQVVIQSSLVVDKQPPQVIKTQSKFSTTPVVLKAQILLNSRTGSHPRRWGDSVGELINNTAILEHNTSSKSTCATFRNMSIKKIKRADRKGSESVTRRSSPCCSQTEITITGCDTPYRIRLMISLPLVVIVHGSQDNNALATVIWDCDRVPFVVPERVPWRMMCSTLNSKFTSEVGTSHNLDQYNQHFLAQKIFDKPDFNGDFSNTMVSWAQFNKEVLPGRQFTFWQWFEGVMELTKKHLKVYWSDGLIFGFIGKQHLHLILKEMPNGTFLLRFSDSEIGGITIAYVSASENGGQKIQNIQPFTKRDLEIRCLGDRIRDINNITHLYPDFPKHDVFKKYYTDPQAPSNTGYIPVSLQTKVETSQFQQPFSPQDSMSQDQIATDFSNPAVVFPEDM
uniref:Signal transducer and activator of transcription n=1 Tax=Sphaeramia orbicularis TaxID=375764 RepID=A0A672ZXU8_9TELE